MVNLRFKCFLFLQASAFVICQICESYHDTIEELNAHYERDHPTGSTLSKPERTEDGKYKCRFCPNLFARDYYVYVHERKFHGCAPGKKRKTHQGTVPCEICGKKFSSQSYVNVHMRKKHS